MQGSKMQELKIEQFCPFSAELTNDLVKTLNKRRAAYFRSLASNEVGAVQDSSESDELLTSVLEVLENGAERSQEDARHRQRWLSDMVYHYLGRLARRLGSEDSKEYDLTECLVKGMRSRLGLRESSDTELLERMANEFSEWLNSRKERVFVAGWGKIVGDEFDDNLLRIEKFRKTAEQFDASSAYAYSASGGSLAEKPSLGILARFRTKV